MFYVINLACILLVVGVHEYGHLFFAKRFGLWVPDFSIGLGPRFLSWACNGTIYSIRLIPFGGFVNIPVEQMEKLPKWRKIQILFGGPLANLLLCVAVGTLAIISGYTPQFLEGLPWYWLLLFVTLGTTILFLILVPLSVWAVVSILLHPIESFEHVGGPIAIIKGEAVPADWINGLPVGYQILLIIYILSLSVGSFNLMPISMLDGGRIFRTLFERFPRFVTVWDWATGMFLFVLIVYLLGGDLLKLALKALAT